MGGGRLNMQVVFLVVAASLLQLHTTNAQTTHTVGDAAGWTIPIPSQPVNYTTWASQQNFAVGDLLVFNFTNSHDVAEVTQAALDSCNTNNPLYLNTTSPTTIVLNSTGGRHFICTFPGHCSLGQRLTINVSAASTPSPAPQPATPPPSSSPTPTPSPVSPPPSSPTPSPLSPPPSSPTPSPGSAPAPSSTATPPSGSAPSPSSTGTPPSGSDTPPSPGTPTSPSPGGSTTSPPPPSPSSATSVAVTAFPLITFLTIALRFLY